MTALDRRSQWLPGAGSKEETGVFRGLGADPVGFSSGDAGPAAWIQQNGMKKKIRLSSGGG
jgi:hypothetical protein